MAMKKNRERSNNRAVIYSRLSPRKRPNGSESCEKQIEMCQRYCDFRKLEVIGVLYDKNKSGAKAANRPGLQLALHKTIKNQAILVVYSLSRLAWNTKETIKIIERLEHAKANLCSISENIDTTKDYSRNFYKMVALFVELERELVSERTSDAMLRHQQGGRRMSFLPPYG
ncbi:MAG: recombinase family protein, partial [Planctomycetota bacterium]